MIFSKGIEEPERMLYLTNTIEARKHFISKMKNIINAELETLKKAQNDDDINYFFEEIYNETNSYLEKMTDSFINDGIARLDAFIFLLIEERFITNL